MSKHFAKLNDERVGEIRTSTRPDSYFSNLWDVSIATVRAARIGLTYKRHPVPPQTESRTKAH